MPGVADYREDAERLAEALRLTQEYVGDEVLPPVEGWSWFDALQAHEGVVAERDPDVLAAIRAWFERVRLATPSRRG